MTSTKNARELDRLRQARTAAQDRFAQQMKLLTQIEGVAADLDRVQLRWSTLLAALAQVSGTPQAASDVSGLPRTDIEAAAKHADSTAVEQAVTAAAPAARKKRETAGAA